MPCAGVWPFSTSCCPPSGTARCRAHGVLRDDATGAGKGVVADMDGVPARIWRQAHLARVGDALRTRRRSDAERLARAEKWHSEAFLRSTRRDPGPGRRSFLTNHRIIQVAATDPSGSPPEARVRTHVDSPMNTEDSQAVYSSTAVKSLLHAASTVPSQLQTTPVTPDQLPRPPTVVRQAPQKLEHPPPPKQPHHPLLPPRRPAHPPPPPAPPRNHPQQPYLPRQAPHL